jgi:hypothetical protein
MAPSNRTRPFIDSLADVGDDCVEWPFGKDSSGYGAVKVGRKMVGAHKVVLERYIRPGRDGEYALHSCNRPACVNPRHLRWGTQEENMRDRRVAGNFAPGIHPAAKLQVEEARRVKFDGERAAVVAAELGISTSAVRKIRRGVIWKHLTGEV